MNRQQRTHRVQGAAPEVKGPRPISAAVVLLASDGTFFCCKIYLIHEHKQRSAEKSQKVKLQNNGDDLLLCERIIVTVNDSLLWRQSSRGHTHMEMRDGLRNLLVNFTFKYHHPPTITSNAQIKKKRVECFLCSLWLFLSSSFQQDCTLNFKWYKCIFPTVIVRK